MAEAPAGTPLTTYLGSRLAVDNLPGSRLVNAETTSKNFRRLCQKTFRKFRRLPDDFTGSLDDFTGSPNDFVRRLPRSPDDFQTTSRRLTEKSDIRTYQNAQIYYERETSSEDFHEVQTTSLKSRRLPGSPDDFLEVQTTSWKSRRLPGSPDDFLEVQTTLSEDFQEVQTTSRRLTGKSSKKSSRSEKPAYQIQI
ncbi:hypothetical protein YC2023_098629 [Brassica napus]